MITLASICLNEEEFIESWLRYHYASFDRIVLCEGAARNYPAHAVTAQGLSTDRTARLIRSFPDPARKIVLRQHGWAGPASSTDDRVPAKMELRNVCTGDAADGLVFTLDIDEFLNPYYIHELASLMHHETQAWACAIPQVHLWGTTRRYITGGYADVPHFRLFRWQRGCRYSSSHNWPSHADGTPLIAEQIRPALHLVGGRLTGPAVIHYGFCESKAAMREKNLYYLNRGEEETRPGTTAFRRAAVEGRLPPGCELHPYRGLLPFQKTPPKRKASASRVISLRSVSAV